MIKKISLFLLFFIAEYSSFAQCAMCKAVVESDAQAGGSASQGVNDGIIYLMMIPYVLMATVGFFIYRHYKKSKLTGNN